MSEENKTPLTGYLMGSALVAALGGLLFGFDTAVISGAEQRLQELFQPVAGMSGSAQAFWHGFLVASALIGTIVGAVAVGKPSDRLRTPRHHVWACRPLFRFGGWQRLCLGLVFLCYFSVYRRVGCWRRLGGVAHVHCRNFSGAYARSSGSACPIQYRVGYPVGVLLQFSLLVPCNWAIWNGVGCSGWKHFRLRCISCCSLLRHAVHAGCLP